jgi:hypothetical protein
MTRTSTSSNTVGTGTKTFTYTSTSNLGWLVGTRLRISNTASNWMEGPITAVSATSVTIDSQLVSGSGTFTSWNLTIAGERGPSGPSGPAGPSGPSGPSGPAGPSGPSGPSGPAGPSGPSGPSGENGTDGTDGAVGATGPTGLGYAGLTSTSSVAVGTGSKTFTTNLAVTATAFAVGQRVRVVSSASPANFMEGSITSFVTTTLVVDVNVIGGSGTIASWNIVSAGLKGDTGASGPSGPSGPAGPGTSITAVTSAETLLYPIMVTSGTAQQAKYDTGLSYNASTDALTVGSGSLSWTLDASSATTFVLRDSAGTARLEVSNSGLLTQTITSRLASNTSTLNNTTAVNVFSFTSLPAGTYWFEVVGQMEKVATGTTKLYQVIFSCDSTTGYSNIYAQALFSPNTSYGRDGGGTVGTTMSHTRIDVVSSSNAAGTSGSFFQGTSNSTSVNNMPFFVKGLITLTNSSRTFRVSIRQNASSANTSDVIRMLAGSFINITRIA